MCSFVVSGTRGRRSCRVLRRQVGPPSARRADAKGRHTFRSRRPSGGGEDRGRGACRPVRRRGERSPVRLRVRPERDGDRASRTWLRHGVPVRRRAPGGVESQLPTGPDHRQPGGGASRPWRLPVRRCVLLRELPHTSRRRRDRHSRCGCRPPAPRSTFASARYSGRCWRSTRPSPRAPSSSST